VTPTSDLCDRYGDLVSVAEPLFRDFGGRAGFSGEIETVRVSDDNALVRRVLEGEGRGRVLVVDGQGSRRCALIGGRLALLASANGWAGLVVNGCVRDVGEIASVALGVKALATCPRPPAKTGAGEQGMPVTFAGITFTPGQWIYGDEDGLVVAATELALSP
jgi:regulator of ribonuclease activity A